MTKKILITGITGQVGSHLTDYVLEKTSYDVVGMMRLQEPMDNLYHLTERINSKDRISLHYGDQYIPKKRRMKTVTYYELIIIENRLNHRSGKRLGLKPPHEVFHASLNRVAVRT